MRLNKTLFISLTLIGLLSVAGLVQAYQPPQPPQKPPQPPTRQDSKQEKKEPQRQGAEADSQPEQGETFKISTDEVLLDVAVIDQTGKPIMSLTKDDFTVYEDKVKQPLESVALTDVPLSMGIVIDSSGSMRTKLQIVSDSALGLIKQMKDEDEAFIAQFKAEAELVRDFTRDKRELEDGLNDLYTGGGTALLDAIIATADHAQEKGRQRKKALVVITDGVEKNSSWKEKEVVKAIQEDDVQVYLVGIIDETSDSVSLFGKSATKKAKDLLISLAEDSGGRAFFPKDASEIPAVMAQISKDLRQQYVVSYSPTNDKKDGTYRTIKVVINPKDNRKLIVRTRQGYTAKATPTQASDTRTRDPKP